MGDIDGLCLYVVIHSIQVDSHNVRSLRCQLLLSRQGVGERESKANAFHRMPSAVSCCVRSVANDIDSQPFVHGQAYWDGTKDHPEIYTFIPETPPSPSAFLDIIQTRVQASPTVIVFAVLDKTQPGVPLAGIIGLLNTSTESLMTELGWLLTLPAFQRTHVTTNAIGLLLTWCLDSRAHGGLSLRRVQYQTNTENAGSIRKAELFGFTREMVQRYTRVVHKPGKWDTVMYSMCWDDWVHHRETVHALMSRKV